MLGKLIKYDLKYGAKIFILVHAILLAACIFGRFFFLDHLDFGRTDSIVVSSLAIFVSVMLFLYIVVCFCTWLIIAARFYRSLFTGEGYLSWTFPVSGVLHLWAKILSGCIWFFLDCFICAAGIILLVTGSNVRDAYFAIAPEVTEYFGMPPGTFASVFFIYMLVSCICSVISTYFCIAAGQLFPSHRILGALIAYFVYSFISQLLAFAVLAAMRLFPAGAYTDMASGIDAEDTLYP